MSREVWYLTPKRKPFFDALVRDMRAYAQEKHASYAEQIKTDKANLKKACGRNTEAYATLLDLAQDAAKE